jgi:hypothetical protein
MVPWLVDVCLRLCVMSLRLKRGRNGDSRIHDIFPSLIAPIDSAGEINARRCRRKHH